MKTELTIQQSEHLIKLGVPKEIASVKEDMYGPALFTLTDLLEILPKVIEVKDINQYNEEYNCKAYIYQEWIGKYEVGYKIPTLTLVNYIDKFHSEELIDALYELTVWCIENGHLKFD